MPTPYLSRETSDHSLSRAPRGSIPVEQSPIDWDTNVFNFISNCGHPGLVRRTSFRAAHASEDHIHPHHPPSTSASFKRRHRRNYSAITTMGYDHQTSTRSPHSNIHTNNWYYVPVYSNNFNSFRKRNLIYPRGFGHTRNISDPTNGWDLRRCEPFIHPLHLPRQISDYSPNDNYSGSGELRSTPPHLTPSWTKVASIGGWQEMEDYKPDTVVEVDETDSKIKEDSGMDLYTEDKCLFPCLQSLANPIVILIGLTFNMFLQTLVLSGLVNGMLTTLERRFNLTTRQVGYAISCQEAACVLTTVLIGFTINHKHNRLRIVGLSLLLMSCGFALFALPHFLTDPYQPDSKLTIRTDWSHPPMIAQPSNSLGRFCTISSVVQNQTQCNASSTATNHTPAEYIRQLSERVSAPTLVLTVFCVAMVLAGIGASPLHVLAPTYLWDNLSRKQYPIYSAIFYSAAGLGPACGFLASAGFLSIYIDAPSSPPRSGLDRDDPLFLGAWWLGMLVCAAFTFLTALPILAFPKRLPKSHMCQMNSTDRLDSPKGMHTSFTPPPAYSPKLPQIPTCFDQSPIPSPSSKPKPYSVGTYPRYPISSRPPVGGQARATSESGLPSKTSQVQKNHADRPYLSRPSNSTGGLPDLIYRKGTDVAPGTFRSFKYRTVKCFGEFFSVPLRVILNPIWFGVTFASTIEQSIVTAFLSYVAKYLQELFQVPAYMASIHAGAVVVPGSVFGVLAGALIMRRFRPRLDHAIIGICVAIGVTVVTTISLMLIGCPSNRMAGVTATYGGRPWPWLYGPTHLVDSNLTAPCNLGCSLSYPAASTPIDRMLNIDHCSEALFEPVCWKRIDTPSEPPKWPAVKIPNYMTFFNPCFAGCKSGVKSNPEDPKAFTKEYSECRCVFPTHLNPQGRPGEPHSILNQSSRFGSVIPGRCPAHCSQYIIFLLILFVHILFTGILHNPSNVITLSCVDQQDSSIALSLQIFVTRSIGGIPAPIYFGLLFDSVCQYHKLPIPSPSKCQSSAAADPATETGACLQYNLEGLPLVWLGIILALKLVSLATAVLTWRYARYLYKKLQTTENTTSANSPMLRSDQTITEPGVQGEPIPTVRSLPSIHPQGEDAEFRNSDHSTTTSTAATHSESVPELST